MYAHEQQRRTQNRATYEGDSGEVEGAVRACERRIREAEQAAKEATHRAEVLKWRIDGRGLRPRRPARRAWPGGSRRSLR